MSRRIVHVESRNHIIISVISTEEAVMDQIVLIGKLEVQLSQTNCASFHISYIRQRRRYMFSPARPRSFVCLSVCVQDYSKTRAWIWMKCCVSTDVRQTLLHLPNSVRLWMNNYLITFVITRITYCTVSFLHPQQPHKTTIFDRELRNFYTER